MRTLTWLVTIKPDPQLRYRQQPIASQAQFYSTSPKHIRPGPEPESPKPKRDESGNVTARVSLAAPEGAVASPPKGSARKDPAVHVSLSSDSIVKQQRNNSPSGDPAPRQQPKPPAYVFQTRGACQNKENRPRRNRSTQYRKPRKRHNPRRPSRQQFQANLKSIDPHSRRSAAPPSMKPI